MSYSVPIKHSFICHNCKVIIWGPLGEGCEECGLQLIPVQEMYEEHVVKARAQLARIGVGKATATEERIQQPFRGENLLAFLTECRTAH